MAKCPKCATVIKFNWCQDVYCFINGVPLDSKKTENENEDLEYFFCECGKWIGIIVTDKAEYSNRGQITYDCIEFDGIDWEEPINRY